MFGLIAGIISGCNTLNNDKPNTEPNLIIEKVILYYGDKNNENFVIEEREISYAITENKYTEVLEELIQGPTNQEYRANIPKETKVLDSVIQNDRLIVNVSKDFNRFGGSIAEIIAVGSIVNTLTQFDEITSVKILVEGNELIGPSGMPRGFMEPFSNNNTPTDTEETSNNEVVLPNYS